MKNNIIFFSRSSLRSNRLLFEFHKFLVNVILEGYDVKMVWYGGRFDRVLKKLRLYSIYLRIIHLLTKPKLILFMDESSSSMLAPKIKKIFSSTTVNISHALVSYHPFYKNINFDYYFVYGEKCIENADHFGIELNSTKIIPIGPLYASVKLLLRSANIDDNLVIALSRAKKFNLRICVTSQWWSTESSAANLLVIYTALADYIAANENIFFYIKPHPLERDKKSPLLKTYSYDNVLALSAESSIKDLAGVVDLHFTWSSNSVIDFALIGIPSVFLRFNTDTIEKYGILPPRYGLVVDETAGLDDIVRNKRYSKADAEKILHHNTDGCGFDSILHFRKAIGMILGDKPPT